MNAEALEHAARLFTSALTPLTDDDVRGASRLPGWSRAHVAAHVVLNAEGFCSAATGLAASGFGVMYPAGTAARDAAIDDLSRASPTEILERLADTHRRFMDMWSSPPVGAPGGSCATASGDPLFGPATVPGRRLRELQVHLIDLDIEGVTHEMWLDEFVEHDLPLQWATVGHRTALTVDVVDETGRRWHSPGTTDRMAAPAEIDRRTLLAWTLDRCRVSELPHLTEWGNRSRWEHLERR